MFDGYRNDLRSSAMYDNSINYPDFFLIRTTKLALKCFYYEEVFNELLDLMAPRAPTTCT